MRALAGYTHKYGVNKWLQRARALQQAEQKWGHPKNLTEKLSESHTGASLSTSVSWLVGQGGSHYLCIYIVIEIMIEAALQSIPIPLQDNLHFSDLSSAVPYDWSSQIKATFTLDMHLQNKNMCPRVDHKISWRIQNKLHRALSNSWRAALLC